MKKLGLLLIIAFVICSTALLAQSDQLPPNPKPGKCYVKCVTTDEYRNIQERVMIAPSYTKLTIVPATYKNVTERVVVKEAHKKLKYVPPIFETVNVSYDASVSSSIKVVPAKFGNSTKNFEVEPSSGKWEYTELEDCTSVNKDDCIVACYVETPPQMKAVKVTTLVSDATTVDVSGPSKKNSYKKTVLKKPASFKEVPVPAVYKTITKRVVDRPARTIKETVPAKYKTIIKRELVKKGGITVWEEVDCNLVGKSNLIPILYEYNSARLTAKSKKIIDQYLLSLMRSKPNIRIELGSHTDSRGTATYNRELSRKRAKSVADYLVSKGINRNRLVARGYGESRLLNKCRDGVKCTDAQHQRNRRTEFRIL